MTLAQFQLLTAVIWAVVSVLLIPAMLRAFSKTRTTTDEWKASVFFIGVLLVAFPSRWLVIPKDEFTWKSLYAIGILVACYVLMLLWNGRKR